MRRLATVLAFLAGLLPTTALSQPFPTMPANTFVGRLGISTGPGQAIPFSYLISLNFLTNLGTTGGAYPVYNATSGAWQSSNGVRTTRTAVDSAGQTDCWAFSPLGGSAFYTYTVPAATGFPTGCEMRVKNIDTGRGKLLAVNSYTSCVLWPLQEVVIRKVGTAWFWTGCYPWSIPAGITFNVNTTGGGSDTNNDGLGTGSGAFQHIATALQTSQKWIRADGGAVTIQLADDTYGADGTDNFVCFGPQPGTNPEISIKGNVTTETNVVWEAAANGNTIIHAKDGCILGIDGVNFTANSHTGAVAITTGQGGIIDVGITGSGKVKFSAFASGWDFLINPGGVVNLTTGTTITVAGNATDFVLMNSGGTFNIPSNFTLTFSGSPTFTNIFEVVAGVVNLGSTITFSGAVTARQYKIDGGTLVCNGNTLPGTGGSLVGGWVDCPAAATIASGDCGATTNGTISGNDRSGIITIGAAATTTCKVTFSSTQAVAPKACLIFPGNAGAAATATTVARVGTPATTDFTITGSALANTVYSYLCL